MNREMDLGSLPQPPYLINYTVSLDMKHHRIERTTSYCGRTVKQTAPHNCRNFALVSSYKNISMEKDNVRCVDER